MFNSRVIINMLMLEALRCILYFCFECKHLMIFFFINIQLSSYHKYAHIGGIMMHFVLLFCIIKHQTKIAADDIFNFLLLYFKENKAIFHVNPLPSRGFT